MGRFKCLKLAYDAIRIGGGMPCVLNAANEVAVGAFLKERIRFLDIPVIVEKVMTKEKEAKINSLEDVFELDKKARIIADGLIG